MSKVVLASVPAVILQSAIEDGLHDHVAFGSKALNRIDCAAGTPVYIYVSQSDSSPLHKNHPLYKGLVASWGGMLKDIINAVGDGPRSGKHPNKTVRPKLAEDTDEGSFWFWEVCNLQPLSKPVPFLKFTDSNGRKIVKPPRPPQIVHLKTP